MGFGVDGMDGKGEKLSMAQVKTALKVNQDSVQKDADIYLLDKLLMLPTDKIAQEILDLPSPTGSRQIFTKQENKS